jgi:prepilin peptidase CpaA
MPIAANTILVAGLVAATVIDIRTRRIPNGLTATMAGLGFAMALTQISAISPASAALGFVLGLALMLPGYSLGATGAGDVKLMGAVGAIVGPHVVVTAFLATAIAGGILALVVAMRRGRLATTLERTGKLVKAPTEARRTLQSHTHASRFAYGPAIAVGSLVAILIR